ncbi:LPS-assembly protein LptD [Primorskyibacter sp. S87]|uniref:LPS-assembly protein LptD n=1 Tax=Primorskyibacter sp. S87 TaxID=3415126 RepID=UPI003C7C036B
MRSLTLPILSILAILSFSASAVAQSTTTPRDTQPQPAPTQADPEAEEQPPAILVADQVFITPERRLIAEGNVEAYQGDTRMTARKITFDRETGKLTIEGPIRIDQGGEIIVLANAAEMDEGLQNGLLTGARMVFDQQLQLAALQMTRVGGRYTQLYKTSVTSCHVCEDGRPPIWQIRAQKVTHDQLERQLYFEGAQFRVLDVPVFYFPGIRLPDPTLERATGFLIPSVRTTSRLGTGIKVPYFFRLGDDKDLTLSPYVSSKTRTLDFRYRQAFRRGRIEFNGAHTRDDLLPGENRGYLFGWGRFNLANDFNLDFDIKTTSDNAYLVDYGLPDQDRLRSELSVNRIKRDSAFRVGLIHYKSLRDSEDDDLIPSSIGDINYEHRLFPNAIGGEFRLGLDTHSHERTSSADVIGRDVARATVDVAWRRHWTFDAGLRTDVELGFSGDVFDVSDDSNYPTKSSRHTPRAAMTFRYPMTMGTEGGTHFLEPIVQLGYTRVSGQDNPNDESNFVEFDQGNLLSLSRFPAPDRREDGATAVVGLNWAHYNANGWSALATIGQVFRQNADPNFTKSSGLSGTSSDVLLAGQFRLTDELALTARGLLNNKFNFSKAELRGDWQNETSRLSSTYIWQGRDPAEGRNTEVSELWFDGAYEFNPNWHASANVRYDIQEARATRAGLGVIYRNECVTVDISINRRYTSSTSLEPTTDFGFSIALSGFAVESREKNYRRSCGQS